MLYIETLLHFYSICNGNHCILRGNLGELSLIYLQKKTAVKLLVIRGLKLICGYTWFFKVNSHVLEHLKGMGAWGAPWISKVCFNQGKA